MREALGLIGAALALAGCAGREVRLFAPRVEVREKTEAEIDLPPGCVITGIGVRAHYDNVSTLWVRFREVRRDGSLGPLREAHLGSEPDRAPEAKVFLPDGWVVVGIGARGSPDWGVSTLRVWGRRWDPAGGGEVRLWSDGRDPGGDLERSALLGEPDRVLTGAGLRLHRAGIAGIYARSARVIAVPEGDRSIRRAPAGSKAPSIALFPRSLGPVPLAAFDPERLQGELIGAWERGAREIAIDDGGLAGTAGEPAIDLCAELLADPFRPIDDAVGDVLRRCGVDDADLARRALARVPQIARLIFSAETGDSEKALDALAIGKETARWLLAQSRRDVARLRGMEDSPWLALVAAEIDDLSLAAELFEPLARAEILSRMFLIDGSPETRAAARRAVQAAREAASKPAFGDREPLAKAILARLDAPEEKTVLGSAIVRVRLLIDAGSIDQAAARLSELIDDARFAVPLARRGDEVGALAGGIDLLGTDPKTARILWGGDGRWRIAQRAGRWAFVSSSDGPAIYFDAAARSSRALLRFEYLDDTPGEIRIEYSAVDPESGERNDYRPAPPVPMQGSGEWREAERMLDGTSFFGRQNLGADLRILPNRRDVAIRAVRVDER